MSWLARIELDADIVGKLRIYDSYGWHQRLWDCYPGLPEQKRNFLSRIDPMEGSIRAWLLGEIRPTCPSWCPTEAFTVKEIAPGFLSHKRYAFDLRANPTKAIVQRGSDGLPKLKANGKRASGKRIPLVQPDDLRQWLERKAAESGFRILETKPLEIGPMVEHHFSKKEAKGYHGGVQFRGVLEVTNSTQFSQAYFKGIGAAKAFGFGLLLIAPV